jgi:hypothetical protein
MDNRALRSAAGAPPGCSSLALSNEKNILPDKQNQSFFSKKREK